MLVSPAVRQVDLISQGNTVPHAHLTPQNGTVSPKFVRDVQSPPQIGTQKLKPVFQNVLDKKQY
jgi:hypothetical protein